ncbi:MAG: hypothetical protein Q9160_000768 [Pyrenula sp. 1 TL-2023]
MDYLRPYLETSFSASASSSTWSLIAAVAALTVAAYVSLYSRPFTIANDERAVEYKVPTYEIEQNANQDENNSTSDRVLAFAPADGAPLFGSTGWPAATKQSIDEAINKASLAQQGWATTTFSQRRRVLRTLLKHVIDHQNEIVEACCLDSGKTRVDASFGEILVTCEKLQWTIRHGEIALKPSRRPTNLLMAYKRNTVVYEPLGVVAAAVSWNYPFHNFVSPIISAIFAGNAIVVKPSEQTCWSATYFTRLVQGAISQCGYSPNIVQSVVCLPELGDYFTSRPAFKHIIFIGSREVAYKVCASAATALTPVTVELGGKDPAIVLDDKRTIRDLDRVTSILLRGVFQSAGQNCIGIERIIALPKTYNALIDTVLPTIRELKPGNVLRDETVTNNSVAATNQFEATNVDSGSNQRPTGTAKDSDRITRGHNGFPKSSLSHSPDIGAQISRRTFDKLERLIESAVSDGARLLCGGKHYEHPRYPKGYFFSPTLLVDVTAEMEIAHEELFAPVFLLMKARDPEDAVSIANSTSYSLGASVFGHDGAGTGFPKGTVDRIVRDVNAGMVSVNDFAAYYMCSMPFGGCGKTKGSGYGRFGGEEGLRALSNIKAICEDAPWAKFLGIGTTIPPPLNYPIQNGRIAWELCQGVVETGYAVSIKGRFGGLQKILKSLLTGQEKDKR